MLVLSRYPSQEVIILDTKSNEVLSVVTFLEMSSSQALRLGFRGEKHIKFWRSELFYRMSFDDGKTGLDLCNDFNKNIKKEDNENAN